MKKPFITLTSDFAVQSQGVGIMEAVALEINPSAHVIHLMHGLPDFNLFYAARTMETISYMPVGYHVCVVDPGVGTKRRPIIIQTGRGDF
jgi:S-adenosylmethionine hydrolase